MDILHLVDRLEELLNQGRHILLTSNVIVDENKMLDLIDQMRVAIPEEVKKAQQLLTQRDRVIAQAQEEANRTLSIARERSDQMVDRESISAAAQSRSDQIIQSAKAEAENIRRDADHYIIDSLTRLEVELDRTLNQVRNGIRTLRPEKPNPGDEPPTG
jgi:cell division septum initiation protein DivIVA